MIGALSNLLDYATGQGAYSVSVPPMDGALRPNSALDKLAIVQRMPAVDNIAAFGDRFLFSAGGDLVECRTDRTGLRTIATFDSPITALAVREDGLVAVALDCGDLTFRRVDSGGDGNRQRLLSAGRGSVTALAFSRTGDLYACVGSALHPASAWKRDLMERGASGSVWRIAVHDFRTTRIAGDLAFPSGIAFDNGTIPVVAEAWRHRLLRVSESGTDVLFEDLPGYPGRLSSAQGGGYWLSVFARRSQIVEFVLREKPYRQRMMREIHEDHWLAPALRSGRSHLDPLQGGAIRALGIYKPWAPSLSYGLLVRLDANCQPIASWHSRADGERHGVTAAVEHNGEVLIACKGDGVLLSLPQRLYQT